jgi:hypothetical protein
MRYFVDISALLFGIGSLSGILCLGSMVVENLFECYGLSRLNRKWGGASLIIMIAGIFGLVIAGLITLIKIIHGAIQ